MVYEIIQHFKIFTLEIHSHINWQAIQNSYSCIALKHYNHKKLFFSTYLHFHLGYSSTDKPEAIAFSYFTFVGLRNVCSYCNLQTDVMLQHLLAYSLLISCYKQLYYPDYVIDKVQGQRCTAFIIIGKVRVFQFYEVQLTHFQLLKSSTSSQLLHKFDKC